MYMTYKTPSELDKLTVRQLRTRRARLAHQVPDLEVAIHGSLLTQRRRCGKPGCRCTRGELHGPYTYLAVRTGGRNRLVYIPDELAETVRTQVAMTTRIDAVLAEISAINLELLARGALR
jgi:hypothetical protein